MPRATVTLALPKVGLLGAEPVGELFLADISVPAVVYHRHGITVGDLFHDTNIVAVDAHDHLFTPVIGGQAG